MKNHTNRHQNFASTLNRNVFALQEKITTKMITILNCLVQSESIVPFGYFSIVIKFKQHSLLIQKRQQTPKTHQQMGNSCTRNEIQKKTQQKQVNEKTKLIF